MARTLSPPTAADQLRALSQRAWATHVAAAQRGRATLGGWQEPALEEGFVNTTDARFAGAASAGFSMHPAGFVELRGVLAVSGADWNTHRLIFTLPDGMRPDANQFPLVGCDARFEGSSGTVFRPAIVPATSTLHVLEDGRVLGGAGVFSWVALDGVLIRLPA